jgi:hypothetical protein
MADALPTGGPAGKPAGGAPPRSGGGAMNESTDRAQGSVAPSASPGTLPPTYSPHAIHTLRTLQLSTLALSQMADNKASMLMGASFVVFSLAVGRSLTGEIPWPFAFLSAVCAAIAVMPSIGRPRRGGTINRLFFGHFQALDEDEWARDVLSQLEADETVFRLMLHDAYQNGQVLQHSKYRYLGYAYRMFVTGLVVTLIAFAIELLRGL